MMKQLVNLSHAKWMAILAILISFAVVFSIAASNDPLDLAKTNASSLVPMPKITIPPRATKLVSAESFGIHIHRPKLNEPWPLKGAGSWRLWDVYLGWRDIQPKMGVFVFSKLDSIVAYANKNNIKLVLPLGNTPQWASARPQETCAYGLGCAAEPSNMMFWRLYVRTIANRYAGKIFEYELLNEVNLKPFWSGDMSKLLEMQKIAYEEIKAVNPNNILIGPSMTGNAEAELSKWDAYLASGATQYMDVASYHLYVPKSNPETAYGLTERLFSIMQQNGIANKPLFNTESGWLIKNMQGPEIPTSYSAEWLRLDQDLAMAYVVRAQVLAFTQGIQRYYWYSLDHTNMGLIEPLSFNKKAAGFAYNTLASQLVATQPMGCDLSRLPIWVCTFKMQSGKNKYLVWSTSDAKSNFDFSFIAPLSKRIDFPLGVEEDLRGNTLLIGQVPVILQ
ncbi:MULTISPECIES: cellulase family glycosylhydrolase [Deefgea]|uniref:Cellulase family glycosylhydrolase n=1 Tax=Deefgea chitinilytica TaxID=570276 RepID=A0ABS2CE65_9NEIS|nr:MULTISPECIES: cellulase family glycosylhydrolase [Deefgea]MBM5572352.1 cellulase family glycosylhydrolase [Deefgea chitinilytica]MBM9889588.1 cellulase family glycosylhydrolase [Deefgea sp. CFH1-16]